MAAPSVLLILTFIGFISLGLPDALNGILWPSVSSSFGISIGDLGYVLVAFSAGYLTSSLNIGKSLKYFGVGGLLSASCGTVILSLLGFAFAPTWPLYLASAVLAGLGAGAIDTGLNAFAARNFSAKHMSWLHACWGVGATSGAAVATFVLAQGFVWNFVPLTIAGILLPVTILFFIKRKMWNQNSAVNSENPNEKNEPVRFFETLVVPSIWLQALIFFVYVGVEAVTGQWAFTILTQSRGISAGTAGMIVSCYWGSLTVGRFLLGNFADKIGVRKLILISTSTGLLGGLIFIFVPGALFSALGLLILGFSMAPIYPGMMSQTPERMGRLSDITIGIQVAAALVGQVTLPTLAGYLLKTHGFGFIHVLLAGMLVLLWLVIHLLFRKPVAVKLP